MNTNAPKTHKVRKGVAAVVMNVILIIFSLSCIFPDRVDGIFFSERETCI